MRISIVAVGRLRAGPERALLEQYLKRLPWPVAEREVAAETTGRSQSERRRREGTRLLAALPDSAKVVALDGRGRSLSSEAFAGHLGRWRDEGAAEIAFVIGGAGGLDARLRERAELTLSLGPMTWPHLMVRAMLAEQLYRAHSILAGHPYHRSG
ncbi:MAG: 23S rRNA (pseudouridine(1915)-N(3))-methyltransferase RlmH [Alphaproteobacteria bacterium]|nr:23S rRNA (pseudouridine(1915)-N(3))-methyltransferase RlmH [Alphaproteobacteria bacterium]